MPWSPPQTTTANRPQLMRMIHNPNGVGYAAKMTNHTSQPYNSIQNKIPPIDVQLIYGVLNSIKYKNITTAFDRNFTISQYLKNETEPRVYDTLSQRCGFTDSNFADIPIQDFLKQYTDLNDFDKEDDYNSYGSKDFVNPYQDRMSQQLIDRMNRQILDQKITKNMTNIHNQNTYDTGDFDNSQMKHNFIHGIHDYKTNRDSKRSDGSFCRKCDQSPDDSTGSDRLFPENYNPLDYRGTPY